MARSMTGWAPVTEPDEHFLERAPPAGQAHSWSFFPRRRSRTRNA